MKIFIFNLVTFFLVSFSYTIQAQSDYPNKPIKIIVPYGPGGSTDVLTRIVAQKLSEKFGSSVIVENRAGANAMIGTELVANAVNDGYILLAASSGNAVNPALMGP